MAAVPGFAICHLAGLVTPGQWFPVTPGNSWMGMNFLNDSAEAVLMRTNQEDAASEYSVPAGGQFQIQAVFGSTVGAGAIGWRFPGGQPGFYIKTASIDGTGLRVVWA